MARQINHEPIVDISVNSSFGSPIMFNPKRGIEASAGVLKDILLGNHHHDSHDASNNNSFNSYSDFEDLDQFESPDSYHDNMVHARRQQIAPPPRPCRSAHQSPATLDFRKQGIGSRPHSNSPARINPARRYSPPQGSTGSCTDSGGGLPKACCNYPMSTSSPLNQRRHPRAPPYYVADTRNHHDSSMEGPHNTSYFMDHHNSSGASGNSMLSSCQIRHQPYHPIMVHPYLHASSSASSGNVYTNEFVPGCCPACPQASSQALGLTDEELQREYAVVLDAVLQDCLQCCGSRPLVAESSPSHIGNCGYHHHHNWRQHHQGILETCVDDEPCEEEIMVSSWTGVCGVPGLGYSIPPPKADQDHEWSAHSAQNLAKLKVDLPRVANNKPAISISATQIKPSVESYAGVSALGHLLSDQSFKGGGGDHHQHVRNMSKKPLMRSSGPSSLPPTFIPRAPIPPPQIKKKSSVQQQQQRKKPEVTVKPKSSAPEEFYQSPRNRDGDYSYAYDCSISPALVIKWNEEEDNEEDDSDEKAKKNSENIYEEIEDFNNSDSGIATKSNLSSLTNGSSASSSGSSGGGHLGMSKGTLDVSRTTRKKVPLSSLDELLSQTKPELTAHQRLNLRKSLVDELFEELIQRHHKRVLDELKLDMEEFIAPNDESIGGSSGVATPKSSSIRLTRCESMDFKGPDLASTTNSRSGLAHPNNSKKISPSSKFMQKCSEVFQRKLKKSNSTSMTSADHQQSSTTLQVSRKGRRPLSAIIQPQHVIHSDSRKNVNEEEDSEDEEEAAAKRLLRSQIIKSFWEQHDQEEKESSDHR